MRPAILIHGPTASGKTKLAIALAKRLDGEIINADAMQVYADLDILTARPDAEEKAAAPHHLFGHVDAATRYSAGAWSKDAAAKIAELQGQGKVPIVVGGTGLYLMALTDGLSEIPPIPEAARREARDRVARDQAGTYADLIARDPAAKDRIDPQDRQRTARALEVLIATGRPISSFHGEQAPVLKPGGWIGAALTPPRETLYARIDTRVDAMMKQGALEEARHLWQRKLDPELPAMRAHGMPGFVDYFDNRIPLADALERCKRDTRRYAKRQMTWIAHQFTLWPRIPSLAVEVRTRVLADLHTEAQKKLDQKAENRAE
ncbi:MAG TPA: tRNA (adenosine(37)-N6)-dimethylallyltransferase MiaA [Hyphomonadaceae bacterium]|nr:tRNA (adenosine(37)-N6)-dimethylallyltransferase MiaA [Hyphomonadaceae bacterium]